eukprot:TRINITY_DN48453_c0_g1_i1.p1 TRINITY_DN48453_c0_g1~~TRINITY_DN48453_c0_g1_i1.p1  ORF type:complete len:309 (+),score=60.36 TRINITY_DN48453_c0_g1_i1:58-927(+)
MADEGSDGSGKDQQSSLQAKFVVRNLAGGRTGNFTVELRPDWAPLGAARFAELVKDRFFDSCRFYRVVEGFVAQFGMHGDPAVAQAWSQRLMRDDGVKVGNTRGRLSFATAGPGTRTTQIFVNIGDNSGLNHHGFAPFAEVVQGLDVIDRIFAGYGEAAPKGKGPSQAAMLSRGNTYLEAAFPHLSYIQAVEIVGNNSQEFDRLVEAHKFDLGMSSNTLMFLILLGIFIIGASLVSWILGCFSRARWVKRVSRPPVGSMQEFRQEHELEQLVARPETLGRKRASTRASD